MIVINEEKFREILKSQREGIVQDLFAMLKGSFASDKKLNAKEAAQILGISLSSLYKSVKRLPHRKFGKKLVFSAQELRDFSLGSPGSHLPTNFTTDS